MYTLEDLIQDHGIIPYCNCKECQKNKINVNVKPDKYGSYIYYKSRGYPKFINGHQCRGRHHSEETKLKMSINNGMKNPEVADMFRGDKNPMKHPEVRAQFKGDKNPAKRPEVRKQLVDMWKDVEFREKTCKANAESWNDEKRQIYSDRMIIQNPMYDDKIKIKHLEILNTKEYRDKMSESTKLSWITKPKINNCGKNSYFYGKPPKHGQRKYEHKTPLQGLIKMFHWDYLLAKYYDSYNIIYYYEHQAFELILNNGKFTTYTPDFYLPSTNEYIEVKGYWRGDAKEKFDAFKIQYPNISIKLLMIQDLKELGIRL